MGVGLPLFRDWNAPNRRARIKVNIQLQLLTLLSFLSAMIKRLF